MKSFLRLDNLMTVALTIVSFLIYLITLSPTVSVTDSGELAAVATTLGIAHPTGYPLFTLLGRLAIMVPVGGEEIVRLNALASIFTALSAGLFFRVVLLLQNVRLVFPSARMVNRDSARWVAPAVSTLVFAFSSTVWSQSTSVEVYSLHLMLILLASTTFIRGLEDQLSQPGTTSCYLFLFTFVLGLSFANHMTTILLAPAFLYLYGVHFGLTRESLRRLLRLAVFFLLGLSVYLFLPIRSSVSPPLDWGHPTTWERFFWHVSGKQYQVWMFEGWDVAKTQLLQFVENLPSEFHWLVLAAAMVGTVRVVMTSQKKSLFLGLLFFTCLFYSSNYQIHDINSYYLLAFVVVAILISPGIEFVVEAGMRRRKPIVGYLLVGFLPILQIWSNHHRVDESENFLAHDTALNIMSEVDQNSVVFSGLWDYFVSPTYYFQFVKKLRPDVVIVDKALMQNRSWYFLQLERNHPKLLARSREKIETFLAELKKFERGEPFNYNVIQARWNELLSDLVLKASEDHEVYFDGRVEPEFPSSIPRAPSGLLFRAQKGGETLPQVDFASNWRKITREGPVSADFRQYFCFMATKNAAWLRGRNRNTEAKTVLDKALEMDPTYMPALVLREELEKLAK